MREPKKEAVAANAQLEQLQMAAQERRIRNPQERVGQSYFNALYFDGIDPEFADAIRGGPLDPFHIDGNLPAMLGAFKARWSE